MYQLIDLGKADFFVDFQSFMSANKVASKSQNCPLWYMYCLNSTLALVCRLMRKSMNLNMTGQFLLYFSYALKRNNLYFDHNLHTYYIQILLLYRHYCRRLVWEFWKTKDQSGCGMGDQRTKYYPGNLYCTSFVTLWIVLKKTFMNRNLYWLGIYFLGFI